MCGGGEFVVEKQAQRCSAPRTGGPFHSPRDDKFRPLTCVGWSRFDVLQGPVRVIMSTQATSPLAAAWSALCSCLSSSSKGRSGGERSEGTKGEKSAKGAK
eukprot:scaffold70745_cov49-Phaeocystis_antarctica.AAC.1